jgi:hypothetical protein
MDFDEVMCRFSTLGIGGGAFHDQSSGGHPGTAQAQGVPGFGKNRAAGRIQTLVSARKDTGQALE